MSVERFFKGKDCIYNNKKVVLYIIIIKASKNEAIVQKYYQKLFYLLKDIIIKNINNFFFLCRKTSLTPYWEDYDVLSECYLIFDKCVKNFNMKYKYSFHFFYNKSLSRAFHRVYQKQQKSTCVNYVDNDFYVDFEIFTYMNHTFFDYYSEKFNLSPLQRKILQFKMNGAQDLDKFVIKNKITKKSYNENFDIIKSKFSVIKKEYENEH
jgi:hypothetical protein